MADTVLFGRYRLVEPAGMGGTAEVWRAVDETSGEDVAIKRLHPALLADEPTRVRLVREFAALRALDHPRIVRVRDLELGRREAALVLDYVHGPSLAVRLLDGPLPPAEVAAIVSDVASALDSAHAAGILHRDVKPGNVLLREDGAALLTDFGIVGGLDDPGDITAVGTIVGTFRYMSPQRLAGEAATPSDDLYSLGVVARQALSGRPPFEASTPVALAAEIADGPPPLDGVPPAVEAATLRAIAPEAAARYADASSFARALEAAVRGAEPTTEPATAVVAGGGTDDARPVPTGARRKRAVPIAALGALAVALLVLAAMGPSSDGSDALASPAPRATRAPTAAPARVTTTDGSANTGTNGAAKDKGDNGKGHGKGKKH